MINRDESSPDLCSGFLQRLTQLSNARANTARNRAHNFDVADLSPYQQE
jgi:hypothetical protein